MLSTLRSLRNSGRPLPRCMLGGREAVDEGAVSFGVWLVPGTAVRLLLSLFGGAAVLVSVVQSSRQAVQMNAPTAVVVVACTTLLRFRVILILLVGDESVASNFGILRCLMARTLRLRMDGYRHARITDVARWSARCWRVVRGRGQSVEGCGGWGSPGDSQEKGKGERGRVGADHGFLLSTGVVPEGHHLRFRIPNVTRSVRPNEAAGNGQMRQGWVEMRQRRKKGLGLKNRCEMG